MSFEQQAYELPEIWQDAWFSPEDRGRFQAVSRLIPEDAHTLLDVGCGNGMFVNSLSTSSGRRFARLAAVDRSAAALAHVRVTRGRASVDALPFRDRSFDVVTAMEVLEHLPVAVFPRALAELARVARKYVFVSVPYRQDLAASMCRCPSCQTRFNADFHMRSFDEGVMAGLLNGHGYRHVATHLLGKTTNYVDRVLRDRLRTWRRPQDAMPAYAICPVCGWHDAEGLREELARLAARAAVATQDGPDRRWFARFRPSVTTHRWIAAVYAR